MGWKAIFACISTTKFASWDQFYTLQARPRTELSPFRRDASPTPRLKSLRKSSPRSFEKCPRPGPHPGWLLETLRRGRESSYFKQRPLLLGRAAQRGTRGPGGDLLTL